MLDLSSNPIPAKRPKRPRQSNLVFALEMLSALAGAGAVLLGGMYILSRFCWWAKPDSRGHKSHGSRGGCGNLAQYTKERLADPDFIPPFIVSLGHWVIFLIAAVVFFGAVAFVIDRIQRGSK